ncbi:MULTISPECIES: methylamine utilization protein [unclassified Undibacterium]|uniref:methylamine utilization protein n=1 Tax=unclassified Undibacterium TaxID=2630295 RepID=UPI002AC9BFCA|nr:MULTISPECIES: methylamine utilization protein [unclassified Undibacterium]MEB0141183.1 methylamine utilization protein [Undibacterium sp. CCC2.1]MEB0173470.1 methylamine utilization protein [Undibacterium sp. CCC1.1]MEB0178164.1 methylamine utilization protein [Undibacterium sp. CCC3.4]MEB0217365.1 methylamine utilization protein [Undibacterium sp. 5I2]WPX44648.1 methylamine utilization protein [Undibacterium sp. CCC3.4]
MHKPRLSITRLNLLLALLLSAPAMATRLVEVSDSSGHPVEDAVVYAEPSQSLGNNKPAAAEVEQKERKFMPLVTVVQTGAMVSFPNNDTVKHHAYSFSPAKSFELKLYSGRPSTPLLFDKAGTVIVGCNIHDQMVAYIHVVNTPYFAKTDSKGVASLPTLPAGKYTLKTWYYKQAPGSEAQQQSLNVGTDSASTATIVVKLNGKAA